MFLNYIIAVLTITSVAVALYFYQCNHHSVAGGIEKGYLKEVPTTRKSGVSSYNKDNSHYIEPFSFSEKENPIKSLTSIIETFPRNQIIKNDGTYLHVIFWSKTFHFIDDVEFLWNKQTKKIEVRSLARCGYSDFEVNRKRLEKIRKQLYQN